MCCFELSALSEQSGVYWHKFQTLGAMFRHLDLKNKAFPAYAVFFVIKVCISALISEKISKSYSHVFF